MKITKASKFVVFVTAIVFMSTQVLPVGWANDPKAFPKPADDAQALTKAADAVATDQAPQLWPNVADNSAMDNASPLSMPPITPPTVMASAPDANGKVNLTGTVTPRSYVYYSFDNQKWALATSATTSGTWSKQITLPSTGTTSIYVRSKSGTDYSPSVTTTVTFVVPAPVVNASVPTEEGRVTLTGTAPAGYMIYYSVNGGSPMIAGIVSTSGAWTKAGILLTTPGSNVISVYAKKGNFQSESTSANVVYTPPSVTPPTVNATVPDANGHVFLSGDVAANAAVYYSFDNQKWSIADYSTSSGTWSKEIELPGTGTTSIYVRSRSGTVYSPSVTTTVTFVVPPPVVIASTPTAEGRVTLSGTVTQQQIVQYSLDGVTWVFAGYPKVEGTWSKEIVLPATGTTTIYTRAKSSYGKFYSESVLTSVTFTVPAPVVNASVPTEEGRVTLSGTGPAGYTIYYSVNGGAVLSAGIVSASGNWTRSGVLLTTPGNNAISVYAKKAQFQSESVSMTVAYTPPSVTPPTVNVSVPTADGKVTLSGTVTPNQYVQYSFDGIKWLTADSSTSTGAWSSYPITLPAAGTTTIYTRSKSRYGNLYSESVLTSVTFTVPAPTVAATAPDANGRVVLSGTVTPGQTVQYSFDGIKWLTADSSTSTGAWSSSSITLPATGTTTIYTRSKTRYGNFYSESVSTNVVFTLPAPTVMATAPDASGKVTLSGTVTPSHFVQYSFDGIKWLTAAYATSAGTWSKTITLPAGITSVYVRAMKGKFYSDSVTQVIA